MVMNRTYIIKADRGSEVIFGQGVSINPEMGMFNGGSEFSPRAELNPTPFLKFENFEVYVESAKIKIGFDLIFDVNKLVGYFDISANKARFYFDKRDKGVQGYSHLEFQNFDIIETHNFEDVEGGLKKSKILCILRGFMPDDKIKDAFPVSSRQKQWFKFNGVEIYV